MRKVTFTVIMVCGAAAFAAASAATPSTKTEHFTLITTSTTARQPVYSVIATHELKGGLTLHLSSGTITLDRNKPHPQVTKTETATACMQTASSRFRYTIAQGTGAYKGISGSGRATGHDAGIERVLRGSCSTNFAAAQGIITAPGAVSLH